jgi:hypothetical protein
LCWTPVFSSFILWFVTFTLQGRELGPQDLGLIRQLIVEHPDWSRWRLSQVLCQHWNWRNGAGQLKDMASRTLLLKLQERGHIQLPPRRQIPANRMRQTKVVPWVWDRSAIVSTLAALGCLQVREVSQSRSERQQVAASLSQFHYLGFGGAVGENLQYTVCDGQGRLLACLVFGSAAWKCRDRDRFIGWTLAQRKANLFLLTNNTRFLVLPWAQVPHLASWALSTVRRRLSRDWQAKYGHPIHLVETFVERDRFRATAYRAANWIRVGETTGRTRQDRFYSLQTPVKDVYLSPLHSKFQQRLCA